MSIIKIISVGELPGMVDYLLTAAFIFFILEMISYFTRSLFAIYCVTWGALFKYLTHGGERRFEKDFIKVIPFLSSEKFMRKFVVVKNIHIFFLPVWPCLFPLCFRSTSLISQDSLKSSANGKPHLPRQNPSPSGIVLKLQNECAAKRMSFITKITKW